jgi:serralysin
MTSFTVSNEVTTQQTLGTGEAGVVTSTGNLMVVGNIAVAITDYAFLNVSGSVFSGDTAVDSLGAGYVNVGTTGILFGSVTAIHFSGQTFASTVNNRGIIHGVSGVTTDNGPLIVVNAGQITGDGSSAIKSAGAGAVRISNSGDIFGALYGVVTVDTTTSNIANSGIISGGGGAMSLSNGISRVVNTGLLDGRVNLGGGADYFNGTGGVQGSVFGGAGADRMSGGAGEDGLFGGTGADVMRGNGADDVLDGGTDADQLFGGAGDDSLTGGVGVDVLRGGEGDDRLTGGTLADTFVFTRGQGTDRITDFANNVDKLDLRAFDFASVAAVVALASASSLGLRIDVPGEGVVFVSGLTLAALNAADLLL